MSSAKFAWHTEILPTNSVDVLSNLYQILPLSRFYLAGGTGLSLIFGHRFSQDFDFFSADLFNEDMLLQKMQGLENLSIVAKDEHTLHIILNDIKISFLGFNYPLLFQQKKYEAAPGIIINVADERDIACMKINAISGRGTRRDFIDLYMASQQYNLAELLRLFKRKFSLTPYNDVYILKSLIYFADAEAEPMPDMLISLSWNTVKKFFISEVKKLL